MIPDAKGPRYRRIAWIPLLAMLNACGGELIWSGAVYDRSPSAPGIRLAAQAPHCGCLYLYNDSQQRITLQSSFYDQNLGVLTLASRDPEAPNADRTGSAEEYVRFDWAGPLTTDVYYIQAVEFVDDGTGTNRPQTGDDGVLVDENRIPLQALPIWEYVPLMETGLTWRERVGRLNPLLWTAATSGVDIGNAEPIRFFDCELLTCPFGDLQMDQAISAATVWAGVRYDHVQDRIELSAPEPDCGCITLTNVSPSPIRLRSFYYGQQLGELPLDASADARVRFDWAGPFSEDLYRIEAYDDSGTKLENIASLVGIPSQTPRFVDCTDTAACEYDPRPAATTPGTDEAPAATDGTTGLNLTRMVTRVEPNGFATVTPDIDQPPMDPEDAVP